MVEGAEEESVNGVGGEGEVMDAWTVASSLPLRPYVGDQMSSSTSWRFVMARSEGSLCVERVSVNTAVGYTIYIYQFMCQIKNRATQVPSDSAPYTSPQTSSTPQLEL